ncbi:uncharacterized protein BDV17DRAFT_272187 [Aspergillus undulatus]|uniref:uncharacterized protein n=1 Tax=Aspergillus undulatus TaxID=1810928 RepID=UPI003CCD6C66
MESAPLTLAHTHARNAVLETRKSNPVAASEEHDLAAGEFATVAQSSRDREALRTLHLLEQHHKRLAHILRFQHENPSSAAESSKTDSQQPPKLIGNPRLPKRETSSIASNLASARGIPAQPRRASPASPTLSSQQAGAKMTDAPAKIRTGESSLRGTQAEQRNRVNRISSQRQPWSPPVGSPTDITSQQFVPAEANDAQQSPRQSATEEPFQRFYSTFEGLIGKISAPLAFAGLPLGSDGASDAAATRKSSADTRLDRRSAVPDRSGSSAEPDISRIFSRAALKAIRETNGGSGMGTGNAAESFYVVPTTGGTVSYAGILTRAEKEARRNSVDEAEDDFVDARETPSSPEMLQTGKGKANRGNNKLTSLQPAKTMEELQMENQALKHLSDTLSKRLHMWEVNAQSSSMALRQSLKAMQQNVPSPEHGLQSGSAIPSPTGIITPAAANTEHDQRIKELEEIIRCSEKEREQAERENEKLHNALGRYRDRWEKLKEGAKNRRAETGARASGAGTAPSNADTDVKKGEGMQDSDN